MDSITVRCSSCDHTMRFGPDKAGRKAKCPRCGEVVSIPTLEEAKSPTPPAVSAAPAATPAPPPMRFEGEEEGPASYGLIKDNEKVKEEDTSKPKDKKKKPPKVLRKVKVIPDAEEWEKVRTGLLFIFFGVCLWLVAHLLHGLYAVLGTVEFPEFDRVVVQELERRPGIPEPGRMWEINQLRMLFGITYGSNFAGFARGAMITCQGLYFLQAILWFVGYFICYAVPPRFGSFGQVVSLTILGALNVLLAFFLIFLPLVGAYRFYMIPLLVPELPLVDYNIERSLPMHILWSGAPFWENFSTIIIQFLHYLEPILGCIFLWSVGLAIKDRRVEERSHGMVQLGFGTCFILLGFQMFSLTGTSPVLILVLKVLYTLWYCFLLLFIMQYASLLLKTREVLEEKINPANLAE